ncbi:MAG TPA: hypothetical protein VL916_12750, partial [Ilumatobacteraceae bacterium]|nr:hypothetical protein [Ilumatobacteraceae bacterium]
MSDVGAAVALPGTNGALEAIDAETWSLTAVNGSASVELRLPPGLAFVLDGAVLDGDDELFVLPSD